nr:unnamed protein product [Callosobruchus chinensis]
MQELRRSKGDPKSWENLSKAISHLPNDQKLIAIEEEYKGLFNEYRYWSASSREYERRCEMLKKEIQQISSDLAETIVTRSNLENVVMDQQGRNREMEEENHNRLKEEEDKRKLVAASFTEKLNTLTTLMDESTDKSLQLLYIYINILMYFEDLHRLNEGRNSSFIIKTSRQCSSQISDLSTNN